MNGLVTVNYSSGVPMVVQGVSETHYNQLVTAIKNFSAGGARFELPTLLGTVGVDLWGVTGASFVPAQ